MEKIIVLGSNGQLGQSFMNCKQNDYELIGITRNDFDLNSTTGMLWLYNKIKQEKPVCVINCIGYTNVDKAETDPNNLIINLVFLHRLNDVCHGTRLVHFSTDYAFDGATKLCSEQTQTAPLNEYGKAKVMADNFIMNSSKDYLIFRIGNLYSKFGNNIFKTFLSNLKTGKKLTVIDDVLVCPTHAERLSVDVFEAIKQGLPSGLYNYSGNISMSWYKFCNIINDELINQNINTGVIENCPQSNYIRVAKRPTTVLLDNSKLSGYIKISQDIYKDIKSTIKELE